MNDGKFKKGRSGNPQGRPIGAKNKTAEQFRALIKEFISENWGKLQNKYERMEDKDQVLFLERMLKHVVPSPVHWYESLTDEDFQRLVERITEKQNELFN